MGDLYSSILDTIGRTPTVRINNLGPDHVKLYAKIEAFNPGGSIKDRLALGVIEAAEQTGALKPGQTIIEATSGNTGIGLAVVCAQKGYPLVVTMAENFSVERRKLMRFLGARVVLTPAAEKGMGMVAKAVELAAAHGWFLTRQFENEANAEIHRQTTAREILADWEEGPDYWVTGFGTGGTLKGVADVLKAERAGIRIIVAEPDNSQLLGSGIGQSRYADGSASSSHPLFRPHLMQGWSPDFIPKLAGDAQEAGLIDAYQPVPGSAALKGAQELARHEGIFCGISGGATFAAALEVAKKAPEGATVLFMVPDTGERYLSTPLFADVSETMTEEERTISASTPGYRFGAASTPQAPSPGAEAKPEALTEVETIIHDRDRQVVMFALEWCEFCWSVRNLFAEAKIPYRSIDLDSVEYQEGNRGGDLRAALRAVTGVPTIPQIFVAGDHIGGATETFDAFNDGSLITRLKTVGVPYDETMKRDAYSFLPNWLHPR